MKVDPDKRLVTYCVFNNICSLGGKYIACLNINQEIDFNWSLNATVDY